MIRKWNQLFEIFFKKYFQPFPSNSKGTNDFKGISQIRNELNSKTRSAKEILKLNKDSKENTVSKRLKGEWQALSAEPEKVRTTPHKVTPQTWTINTTTDPPLKYLLIFDYSVSITANMATLIFSKLVKKVTKIISLKMQLLVVMEWGWLCRPIGILELPLTHLSNIIC